MQYESRTMGMWRSLSTALAAGFLVAACGSSSASPTAPADQASASGFSAADLCALVTPAEVSAALGNAVAAGVPSGVNAPSCTWQGSTGTGASLTIAATSPDSVGQLPFGLQNVPSPRLTAVSGIGDAAFFASGATGATAEFDVRKGNRAVTITVGSTDPNYTQQQQEAAEQAVGAAAAARM